MAGEKNKKAPNKRKPKSVAEKKKPTSKEGGSAKSKKNAKRKNQTKPSSKMEKSRANSTQQETTGRTADNADNNKQSKVATNSKQSEAEVKTDTRSSQPSPGAEPNCKKGGFSAEPPSKQEKEKEESSKSGKSSRIRDLSGRVARRVKTFVSRPVKKESMGKVVAKVQARKHGSSRTSVHNGEDCFVKAKPVDKQKLERTRKKRKLREVFATKQQMEQVSLQATVSPTQVLSRTTVAPLPSGTIPLTGNKDNEGNVLLPDGAPFWSTQRKPTDEELEEDGTEDDLPMDSEALLEVHEGKTKLVNMPAVPIVLDAMNELAELAKKDELFFDRDILFGNTIRNIIHLDESSTKGSGHKRGERKAIEFTEPLTTRVYDRTSLDFVDQAFKHTEPKSHPDE